MDKSLLDMGSHPEIFADEIGDVQFVGVHARIIFVSWRKIDGIFRRCIACEVIRPVEALPKVMALAWRRQFGEETGPLQ